MPIPDRTKYIRNTFYTISAGTGEAIELKPKSDNARHRYGNAPNF
ncbi:hypothetical protein [Floridanema evergladense]|uniref:Uncharacterized protein n=1 Tax=Floridaenema evergladense BLCC-F167 TaxID=3153639 RepID=A0ABV4WUU5_9CYAN